MTFHTYDTLAHIKVRWGDHTAQHFSSPFKALTKPRESACCPLTLFLPGAQPLPHGIPARRPSRLQALPRGVPSATPAATAAPFARGICPLPGSASRHRRRGKSLSGPGRGGLGEMPSFPRRRSRAGRCLPASHPFLPPSLRPSFLLPLPALRGRPRLTWPPSPAFARSSASLPDGGGTGTTQSPKIKREKNPEGAAASPGAKISSMWQSRPTTTAAAGAAAG